MSVGASELMMRLPSQVLRELRMQLLLRPLGQELTLIERRYGNGDVTVELGKDERWTVLGCRRETPSSVEPVVVDDDLLVDVHGETL